jgi:glycosyltransferase involved in cell wall biosynthesis
MKKILFIPHHPLYGDLKLRLGEMARTMPPDAESYLLNWTAAPASSLRRRIFAVARDLFRRPKVRRSGEWSILEIPMLHRPLAWAGVFNARMLLPMIRQLGIDCVVNGSYYLFSLGSNKAYTYVVDIADLPASPNSGAFGAFIEQEVRKEIGKADVVTASSSVLADYLVRHYGARRVDFLPNGADLQRFRRVKQQDKTEILDRLGFRDRWVIGYIGYLGSWVDVPFMVDVFRGLKKVIPEAALLFVGSGPGLARWRKDYRDKDIVFLGSVPPEKIEAYFCVCDIGVLPNVKSPFQDMAFHIKVIEFAAARRCVICSDLEEVERLCLPFVTALPLRRDLWEKALQRARTASWVDAWDQELDKYDWRHIVRHFTQLVDRPNGT